MSAHPIRHHHVPKHLGTVSLRPPGRHISTLPNRLIHRVKAISRILPLGRQSIMDMAVNLCLPRIT